jgi:hypothetical protein
MSDELWVSDTSPVSGRSAIVESAGDSVWLYLTAPDGESIAADCWLFNRVPAPASVAAYRNAGGPPPAVAVVVGDGAHRLEAIGAARVTFRWSPDGESVAALVDGVVLGFIAAGRRHGHSRHLRADGPWGAPFDAELYRATFDDAPFHA